jgi:DNA-binding NarL/FixJ family response regulator
MAEVGTCVVGDGSLPGSDLLLPLSTVEGGGARLPSLTSPLDSVAQELEQHVRAASGALKRALDDLDTLATLLHALGALHTWGSLEAPMVPATNHPTSRAEAPHGCEMRSLNGLTARESQVAIALATGLAPKQIAPLLGITLPTVQKHLEHIFSKLGVHSQVAAAITIAGLRRSMAATATQEELGRYPSRA